MDSFFKKITLSFLIHKYILRIFYVSTTHWQIVSLKCHMDSFWMESYHVFLLSNENRFPPIHGKLMPKSCPISIFPHFKNNSCSSGVLDFTSLFQVRKWTVLMMAPWEALNHILLIRLILCVHDYKENKRNDACLLLTIKLIWEMQACIRIS